MRSQILLLFVFAICVAAVPGQAAAQAGPPLLTDDPDTPGNGHWEINVAWTLSQNRTNRLFGTPLLDINYGLGQRLQLKAEVPWLILKDQQGQTQSGIGSTNLGAKWRFLDHGEHGFKMSAYPQLEIRTSASSARRGLIEKGAELRLPIEMSREIGPIAIDAEVGYQFVQHEKDEVVYGLAVRREINKRFELLAEIHGAAKRHLADEELIFNVGGRFKMSKDYTLLFSSGRSLRGAATGRPRWSPTWDGSSISRSGSLLSFGRGWLGLGSDRVVRREAPQCNSPRLSGRGNEVSTRSGSDVVRPEGPTSREHHAGPSDLFNHSYIPDHDLTIVAIESRPFGPRNVSFNFDATTCQTWGQASDLAIRSARAGMTS